MDATLDDRIRAGQEAMERHAWQEAFQILAEADEARQLTPDGLALLGDAAWWAGRFRDAISARERAFAGFTADGQNLKAADVAMKVGSDHFRSLSGAVARGWYARAEQLLSEEPESAELGRLFRDRAWQALAGGDLDTALEKATIALEIGTRLGDRNVMAMAMQIRGQVLVGRGQVEEGLAMQDEATVAAVSGELDPMATGIVYCNVISICSDMADYRRAGEWTEAAERWCERQSINGFPGICRVHRAEIMRLRGAWADAEKEAQRACTELTSFGFLYIAASAFYELGEIRLRMGELALAEEAFRQADEMGRKPQPGLALLRLTEGKTAAAFSAIKLAVAEAPDDPLARAKLLPAQVRIALEAQALDVARAAVEELEAIAATYATPALKAMAAVSRGAVQTAEGGLDQANSSIRRGIELWREIDLPYEAAEARVLLALAYRAGGDEDAARSELDAARSTFARLGAPLDARRAAELLGEREEAVQAVRTFMFTDIVRSTNLVEAIGDAAWTDLVRWHDAALRACFAEQAGEEVDHAGDGFFVAFDSAARALSCAIAVQRKLAEHRKEHGFAPQVRIGVHVAAASQHAGGYKGKGVHEAARIGGVAEGDEIVTTRATLEASGEDFPASQHREVVLKGIAVPVEVLSIDWRTA